MNEKQLKIIATHTAREAATILDVHIELSDITSEEWRVRVCS